MARVLVIEPNRGVRQFLELDLTLEGHRTTTAPDGATGLEAAAREAPDAVVLAYRLPDMGAAEAVRKLRHLCPRAALIFFSTVGDFPDKPDLALADACVVKTASCEALHRAIARVTGDWAPGGPHGPEAPARGRAPDPTSPTDRKENR
ncbi:MAG: response regulator [Candidatus Dadabacteria bacterium]|nr:MAG: response regulator [Candidatus Dadabacteria bacterium]